jgi:hypothetical protein
MAEFLGQLIGLFISIILCLPVVILIYMIVNENIKK